MAAKTTTKTSTNGTTKQGDRYAEAQLLVAAEKELVRKYPKARIVRGTLRKGKDVFEGKRVVDIKCKCGKTRVVATSDVFHCYGMCKECIAEYRAGQRSEKRKEAAAAA